MTISVFVLTAIIVLIMFGAGQRFLDKMRLSDKWAVLILGAIVVGIIIPPIKVTNNFSFSIGGFLIPFMVCVYLLVRSGWSFDLLRGIIGSILTAGAIIGLNLLLPSDTPEDIVLDNTILYGIVAGLIAYLLGRSRRNALICSCLGITISNVGIFIYNHLVGVQTPLNLGGGGTFETIIVASLISVGLCELMGKTVETVVGKSQSKAYNFEAGEFVEIKKPKRSSRANEKAKK